MKARRPMKCECCKAHIATGSQYVVMFGRPWLHACALAYKQRRRQTFG